MILWCTVPIYHYIQYFSLVLGKRQQNIPEHDSKCFAHRWLLLFFILWLDTHVTKTFKDQSCLPSNASSRKGTIIIIFIWVPKRRRQTLSIVCQPWIIEFCAFVKADQRFLWNGHFLRMFAVQPEVNTEMHVCYLKRKKALQQMHFFFIFSSANLSFQLCMAVSF